MTRRRRRHHRRATTVEEISHDNNTSINNVVDYDETTPEMGMDPDVADLPGDDEARVPDQSTDVEELDANPVSGQPGQSSVAVAKRRKKAETEEALTQQDVENLDGNTITEDQFIANPLNTDVEEAVAEEDQLQLANTPDDYNDGTETGFDGQNTDMQAFEDVNDDYEYEAKIKAAARKEARVHMMLALKVCEAKEKVGLADPNQRFQTLAKLEEKSAEYLRAQSELLAELVNTRSARQNPAAARTRRVASSGTRVPSLGRSASVGTDNDPLSDELVTL